MSQFTLDPQLGADSLPLLELDLCTLRVMNDATYPWILMVPKQAGLAELIDLSIEDQHRLTDEIRAVSTALQAVTKCDKLNVAALGNMVRQLHIHVIARFEGDAAWPGPVWGKVPAVAYDEMDGNALIADMKRAIMAEL
ncbi:HIT domain-containing protein [Cohaesibacter sp. CAU 1516]|uniref:HIT domain-containing protein n=1 Tax=Cohaesibacter sp. CAU 1516 TaxID=2576038 RepID=UPI0010FD9B0F|nr:HIT family protein [Cohaesibacter sp. CAU 1516]TLP45971.1 HIT domain-containing protein [Cohaesibacter sp. CAU 1516]